MNNAIIEVPNLGESIEEAIVAKWLANDGEMVHKNDVILELESDKANVDIHSPETGILHIKAKVGNTVKIGHQVGEIETTSESQKVLLEKLSVPPTGKETTLVAKEKDLSLSDTEWSEEIGPLVKTMGKKLLKGRLESVPTTTYTDVDMSKVTEIRDRRKNEFKEKFGIKLGLMSFFSRAVTTALKEFPILNAKMHENKIIFNNMINLGIAVTSDKGLVVPVIKNANELNYVELENAIAKKAEKASQGKLDLSELSGGTFTITNGGVFGSLFSTPVLNTPQVGILGMHRIEYRPVAIKDEKIFKLEIRPMMYLALTYDHRLVEGKLAIKFLARIKENLENVDEDIIFQLAAIVQ